MFAQLWRSGSQTERAATIPRRITPLSWAALAVSLFVSGFCFALPIVGGSEWLSSSGTAQYLFSVSFVPALAGVGTGIALATVAGSRGGANRVVGVIAGLMLLAPPVAFVVSAILTG